MFDGLLDQYDIGWQIKRATCKLVSFMANLSIAFWLVVMNTTIRVIESSHLYVSMLQLWVLVLHELRDLYSCERVNMGLSMYLMRLNDVLSILVVVSKSLLHHFIIEMWSMVANRDNCNISSNLKELCRDIHLWSFNKVVNGHSYGHKHVILLAYSHDIGMFVSYVMLSDAVWCIHYLAIK